MQVETMLDNNDNEISAGHEAFEEYNVVNENFNIVQFYSDAGYFCTMNILSISCRIQLQLQ